MASPLTDPVRLAGIYFFLLDRNGESFRFPGIVYLALLMPVIFLKAKDYYPVFV